MTTVGVTLWSKIVREVFLGIAFAVKALIGALILLFWPQALNQRTALI